jgi:membrane associated rhomboid family serine protease
MEAILYIGISQTLFASILIFPTGGIYLFPLPFAIPSWLFGILYLIYSVYMERNGRDNVGHSAHFWGAVFGLVFTIIVIPGIVNSFITQLFG